MGMVVKEEHILKEQVPAERLKPNRFPNVLRILRPHQWLKNSFVLIGVVFSENWHNPIVLTKALIVTLAFCLVSSAVYVLNDLFDLKSDRQHPQKCNRPLAAGLVSRGTAVTLMLIFTFAGLLLGRLVSVPALALLALYFLQNLAYSTCLKRVVILDVFIIALGFILRILAGTWGIGIVPSHWLLLCSFMLTLFIGFGKRLSELSQGTAPENNTRAVLDCYNFNLLFQFMTITAGGTIITYSLYTLDPVTVQLHQTNALIYTVPFVIYGIFRYLYLVYTGREEDPSRLVVKDPHIVMVVLLWLGAVLWLLF